MYIVSKARLTKNAKSLVAGKSEKGTKLWVQPPTLFNTEEKARELFDAYVDSLQQCTTFVKVHKDPRDPDYAVLEFTDEIIMVRITTDSPED